MSGIDYFTRGLKLLNQPGIRRYVVLPVLFNLVLFFLMTWLLVDQLSQVTAWLETMLTDWLDWLLWILWVLIALLWLVIYGYSFSLISNSLAAPFYGLLAEKVQAKLTGNSLDEPMTLGYLSTMVRRTLVREWQKLKYLLPRLLVLIVISIPLYFIPVVGVITPVLWFAWSSWSLALENIDYTADNNQITFSQMRQTMSAKRSLHFTFGAACALAASIPLFNLLAVPAAVAGGTALWLETHHDAS
jgi:CysZ protein